MQNSMEIKIKRNLKAAVIPVKYSNNKLAPTGFDRTIS